jgi:hypothetical protein
MTFQNPLQNNDCIQNYQNSHLDYLCALGDANDIAVERLIAINSINKLGFNPIEQKRIEIHIPSQLLEYGNEERFERPKCGIRKSLIIRRHINDVVLKLDKELLEWELFLENSIIPDRPAKVRVDSSEEHNIGEDAFEENMNIDHLRLFFNVKDSFAYWTLQVSCASDWFKNVCCAGTIYY